MYSTCSNITNIWRKQLKQDCSFAKSSLGITVTGIDVLLADFANGSNSVQTAWIGQQVTLQNVPSSNPAYKS